MSMLNFERFAKVLALAESDQDGEALAAVRTAVRMARSAGMSLGEAIAPAGGARTLATAVADLSESLTVATLKARVAHLERQLVQKRDRDQRYQEGLCAGIQKGRADAQAEFAARDAYQDGYRAGFDVGGEAERAATNRAYSRGFADGKASATVQQPKTQRRQKGRAA